MADQVPEWLTSWPSTGEYSAAMVQAVNGVLPETAKSYDAGSLLSGPIAVQVEALAVAFEETTGVSFGELAQLAAGAWKLATADTPEEIALAAFELVDGAIQMVQAVATAAGMASDMLDAIPVIGEIINIVAGMVVSALEAHAQEAQGEADCAQLIAQKVNVYCGDVIEHSRPLATGPNGLDPSDVFRPLMYVWRDPRKRYNPASDPSWQSWLRQLQAMYDNAELDQNEYDALREMKGAWDLWYGPPTKVDDGGAPGQFWDALAPSQNAKIWKMPWKLNTYPAGAPALFLGLCGAVPTFPGPYTHVAPRDFALFWARDEYELFSRTIGGCEPIPERVQARMWELVRALMLGARDPRADPHKIGRNPDGGRALYPVLQDIVNNERHRGHITPELLRGIQNRALYHTRRFEFCGVTFAGTRLATKWTSCFEPTERPRIDLAGPFWTAMDEYDARLAHLRGELESQLSRRRGELLEEQRPRRDAQSGAGTVAALAAGGTLLYALSQVIR